MRVNMDSSIAFDPRFKIVAKAIGVSFREVIGCCFLLWLHCYQSRSERLTIAEADATADAEGFARALIAAGLADADGEFCLIVHGVKSRIRFLLSQKARGSKGGRASAKSKKDKELTDQANAQANGKHSLEQPLAGTSTTAQAYSPTPSPTPSPSKRHGGWVPPTVEEVSEYCRERGNRVDPELFVDHYTANGWRVSGKSQMKDWKASVRTWEKNNFSPKAEQAKQPTMEELYEEARQEDERNKRAAEYIDEPREQHG